jgi:hypothetical protein
MRTLFSLAATAVLANAGITIINETSNECWFNEGAVWNGECSDLYYWFCDDYSIEPESSCLVRVQSDTQIITESEYITAAYWIYAAETSWMKALEDETAEDSSSSSFDSFISDLGHAANFATFAATKLNVEGDAPHERYIEWVDPFEADCYELNTKPISYDIAQKEKLNYVSGLCGFKIQLTNSHEYAPVSL